MKASSSAFYEQGHGKQLEARRSLQLLPFSIVALKFVAVVNIVNKVKYYRMEVFSILAYQTRENQF